jgi:hypothetical protein
MLGGLCLFRLEKGITKHECTKARKQSSMKKNSSRILLQTLENQHLQKVNKGVSMVKQIILFILGSGWLIGKLEIRERQARHVNNQASNMHSKVA